MPAPAAVQSPRSASPLEAADPFPVREYIAAMSAELAGMARELGDEPLARALDKAARAAGRLT